MTTQNAYPKTTRYFSLLAVILGATLLNFSSSQALGQSGNTNANPTPKRGIVGQQAPAWSTSKWIGLPTGKKSFDIQDVKGKVTYLYFFQSWCPGCHRQGFPTLKTLEQNFRDQTDVQFVAIQTTFEGHHTNTPDKLEAMSKRYNLKIPFGQSKGTSGTPQIMQAYRSGGTPWVVIIDKQGKVVFNGFHIDAKAATKGIEALRTQVLPKVQ